MNDTITTSAPAMPPPATDAAVEREAHQDTALTMAERIRELESDVRRLSACSEIALLRDLLKDACALAEYALQNSQSARREDHEELDAIRREGGVHREHNWGAWQDDPAGVVRRCAYCGEIDYRPEG